MISLSVCLSVREHMSEPSVHTILHQIFVACYLNRGSVLDWRRCYKLRTSGFVDGVMFSRNGPYGTCDASKCELKRLARG